jgi:hypothetical protein
MPHLKGPIMLPKDTSLSPFNSESEESRINNLGKKLII